MGWQGWLLQAPTACGGCAWSGARPELEGGYGPPALPGDYKLSQVLCLITEIAIRLARNYGLRRATMLASQLIPFPLPTLTMLKPAIRKNSFTCSGAHS